MRIIELGSMDIRFICPKCRTQFEINTNELIKTGEQRWSCFCPLCGNQLNVGDVSTIDFLSKRDELSARPSPTDIMELDLSVRAYHCLKRAGLETIEEITSKTESQLKQIRQMGKKTLREIKQKLALLGLHLKEE